MPSVQNETHFSTIQKFESEFSPNTFTQYESQRTGLKVVVVDQEGPKVVGTFALATEIFDDSGAPHTLEHLCFMGSRSYPYKGVLDKLATRAYSNTNAWTATDHTAYTLDTAGWAGFSQILPVYLDHVILPTLTDSGCYTEVHHIDGTGHDAGVVYSEMQGVQNNPAEIMNLRTKRLLYPEGVGFRYETGGMMEQLRVLTADRIRQFHRDMYQPRNLCLIIVGEVNHDELLRTLDDFETSILDYIPKPDAPFKRPWAESGQVPPLQKSSLETVEFPEKDESSGEIEITFLGPSCNDFVLKGALMVVLTYLAGSSVAVLENILVEKEMLASSIYYSPDSRPDTVISFSINGVETQNLERVEARFFEVLRETSEKELNRSYLMDCISRLRRQEKFFSESADSFFTSTIISNFLFGVREGLKDIASLKEYDELETWTDLQWRQFMKHYLADAKHISILGKPSAKLSKKLTEDEEARVEAQRTKLGEAGLKQLEESLAAAKAENDKEIPKEILERFKVPDTSSIHFIRTTTARSGAARHLGELHNPIQDIVDRDSKSPLFIHFEHVNSNFIQIALILGTASIPVHLRPLLSLYLVNFFDAPVNRNGTRTEFEQVVVELEKDTVSYSIDSGSRVGNPEVLRISLEVEKEKYAIAIKWLKELLWDGIFDATRIQSATSKLLADIPDEKRDGSSMTYSAAVMTDLAPESIGRARDTLVKCIYLKRVKRMILSDPQTIISQLEEIRHAVSEVSNLRVLVIGNIEKLENPVSSWDILIDAAGDSTKPLVPLDQRLDRLSDAGKKPGNLSYIIPLSAIDSSYYLSIGRGLETYDDPRLPTVMVATAYLDAVEGPMWTAVRGTGLAYGCGFDLNIASGTMAFSIYRSPDAFKAYVAAKAVVERFISGTTHFDSLALEGAISSIVLSTANSDSTNSRAAQGSFIRQVIRGLPRDWNDLLLKRVRDVRVEEIRQVMEEVLLPVFEAKTANVFVTCARVMEEHLVHDFQQTGFDPQVKTLGFFEDDYGLGRGDGGGTGDEGSGSDEDGGESDGDDDESVSGDGDL